jgi:hypothetical protein
VTTLRDPTGEDQDPCHQASPDWIDVAPSNPSWVEGL